MKKLKKILIVIMLLIFVNQVQAVNWNSIEVNDVEYYVQTDKSTYQVGENVEMLYRITNLGTSDITFTLPASPVWNFTVEKEGVGEIYRAVNGWYTIVVNLTLASGEYFEYPKINPPFVWDMRDNNGNMIDIGHYNVCGGLYAFPNYLDFTKVSVPIEVVPEPATIAFLILGIPAIRGFLKRKAVL